MQLPARSLALLLRVGLGTEQGQPGPGLAYLGLCVVALGLPLALLTTQFIVIK